MLAANIRTIRSSIISGSDPNRQQMPSETRQLNIASGHEHVLPSSPHWRIPQMLGCPKTWRRGEPVYNSSCESGQQAIRFVRPVPPAIIELNNLE